jgi:hypothetical protein
VLVTFLLGCEEPKQPPRTEPVVACAESSITPEDACGAYGPICGPGEIELARELGSWDVGGSYLVLHHVAPAFVVRLGFDEDVDVLAPEELPDHLELATLELELDDVEAERGTPRSTVDVPDARVEEIAATEDGLGVVLSAPAYVVGTTETVYSYDSGCWIADDISACPCEFEIPASVRVEVDAPFGR